MRELFSITSRALFVLALVAAGVALWEKVANLTGRTLTLLSGYTPSRLLELAAVALLFVIAMQLREIRHGVGGGRGMP